MVNPLRDPRDRRLPRIAGSCGLVMFGVTGDLARKKLMPAVYDLANRGLLPPAFALTGFARRDWDEQDFAAGGPRLRQEVRAHAVARGDVEAAVRRHPLRAGHLRRPEAFAELRRTVEELDAERGTGGNHAFYLSIPPSAFPQVITQLRDSGLSDPKEGTWRRVVIEKPFGDDLETANQLNDVVSEVFPPDAVFRIDHYLGKETVQNLLALRFANQLFEPIWNSQYVDHVQITMAEDIGIGGRAGYYDGIGAARDVIQNHLLQLLALTAMEEPASFGAADLRTEKEKVLRAVRLPDDLAAVHGPRPVRGRLARRRTRGRLPGGGRHRRGLRSPRPTPRSSSTSRTDAGMARPFYLRAGKRLGRRVTEIALVFKKAPSPYFQQIEGSEVGTNALVIRVQPDEGVTLRFGSKVPGTAMEVRDVTMDFAYGNAFTDESPEAYERLILDVLLGDPPLFPRHEEVALSWKILDPITEFWATQGQPEQYRSGTWGPAEADAMMARDGRVWRRP